jgi:hypothetical protein
LTFSESDEEAGAPAGEDFWKKDAIERCFLVVEDLLVMVEGGFAGVRLA